MLKLINITKNYQAGDSTVTALKGIALEFRKTEFVSILGPSGCGKTTLLNIIGGLDRYTSGDLQVDGVSTKKYRDTDWDIYRNKAIGFVFQSYNLISHQTVLSNVELALTLSGVSKAERKRRAIEALQKVGLGDQINKKPNQMSGGQEQRVAIARALVNNPEILLADEPTGALDSATSLQIMDVLKEVAKDRLVIMVTHNPDLAHQYSNRIINLLDGEITGDSNPVDASEEKAEPATKRLKDKKNKKKPLSLLTAMSLSMNNLLTKKARTLLTCFAGSIGIIGIALILAVSTGMQLYIKNVQQDTMSSYPITIQGQNVDLSAVMTIAMNQFEDGTAYEGHIYSNDIMNDMLESISEKMAANDLAAFKSFVDDGNSGMEQYVNDIQYGYNTPMNIYKADTSDGLYLVNPTDIFSEMMPGVEIDSSTVMNVYAQNNVEVWQQLMGNDAVLNNQYEVLAGKLPESWNEIVIIADENNQITDYALYVLGLKDKSDLPGILQNIEDGQTVNSEQTIYEYDGLLNLTFKLLVNTDIYKKNGDVWVDKSGDEQFMTGAVDAAEEVSVVGILRPAEGSSVINTGGAVGYTAALMEHLVQQVNDSDIVKAQQADPDTDVFTGLPFDQSDDAAAIDPATLTTEQQAALAGMSEEEQQAALTSAMAENQATYDGNLELLGVADLDEPSVIRIYPKDFDSKDAITGIINDYNQQKSNDGDKASVIEYTDYTEVLMKSVNIVINGISYVLMAFVSISLVVSSIMIGIITYISVLERTKEIGILRSIGASKGDISRVFNAETFIEGLVAGLLGIGLTLLLCIPANAILYHYTSIPNVAQLPWAGAVVLVIISVVLTLIAGLIPSSIAARKDPVIALRTE